VKKIVPAWGTKVLNGPNVPRDTKHLAAIERRRFWLDACPTNKRLIAQLLIASSGRSAGQHRWLIWMSMGELSILAEIATSVLAIGPFRAVHLHSKNFSAAA
jgi:hypothetical protein